jgi:hypothetical protein
MSILAQRVGHINRRIRHYSPANVGSCSTGLATSELRRMFPHASSTQRRPGGVDKRDPISPSQAANPLEFLSVFLKFCCVVPAEFLPAIGIVGHRVQQYARSQFGTRRTPRRALPGCSAGWCVTAGWSEHRQRAGPRPRSASLRNRRSNGRGLRASSSPRAFASERASPRSAL